MTILLQDAKGEYTLSNVKSIMKIWSVCCGWHWVVFYADDTEEIYQENDFEILQICCEY